MYLLIGDFLPFPTWIYHKHCNTQCFPSAYNKQIQAFWGRIWIHNILLKSADLLTNLTTEAADGELLIWILQQQVLQTMWDDVLVSGVVNLNGEFLAIRETGDALRERWYQ